MKKRRHLILAAILVLIVIVWALHDRGSAVGLDQAPRPDQPVGPAAGAPGALLVDLVDGVSQEQIAELEQRYGIDLELNSRYSEDAQLQIASVSERRIATLIESLRQEEVVEVAERDGLYRVPLRETPLPRQMDVEVAQIQSWFSYEPDDPLYQHQWHMDQISMPAAWRLNRGRGVVVAVIDTGVAYANIGDGYRQVPDLANTRFVDGYDFVDNDDQPFDEHGHGTHVAGTIAQSTNNAIGVTGVAFEARIMPLRVLNKQGYGSYGDIADSIRYAADHGADVINMSLGGPIPSLGIWRAVRYARSKGVVVVAAAGNTGRRGVQFPGALSQVIGVSATRYDEQITYYSSYGPHIDVAAPGGDTRVDQNGDGMADGVLQNTILPGDTSESDYLLFNGTSMASPHVAGAAALLVAEGITNPEAVERILERTARIEGRDADQYGAGIIDAAAALRHVQLKLGGLQLTLGLLLAGLMMAWLRRSNQLDGRPGVGLWAGVVVGASGLFFLPQLFGMMIPDPLMIMLSHPIMAWDLVVLGPGGHANPLFHSAVLPVGLVLVFFGVRKLRPLVAGLSLGAAAYLMICSLLGTVDVTYLPYQFLDHIWLWANALICAFLGMIVLRKGR